MVRRKEQEAKRKAGESEADPGQKHSGSMTKLSVLSRIARRLGQSVCFLHVEALLSLETASLEVCTTSTLSWFHYCVLILEIVALKHSEKFGQRKRFFTVVRGQVPAKWFANEEQTSTWDAQKLFRGAPRSALRTACFLLSPCGGTEGIGGANRKRSHPQVRSGIHSWSGSI